MGELNADDRLTWRAGESDFFRGSTMEDARKLLGTRLVPEEEETPVRVHGSIADKDIPTSFDATTQWADYVHPIRNQQQCGSCWAFSASEVLSDRFSIATNGSTDVVLSPEDVVSCDKSDEGCSGGILSNAWHYLSSTGIVSDACFPYTAGGGKAPACSSSCVDGGVWKKYKATNAHRFTSVAEMQKELMTNGPVQVAFTVYKSFMSYKSGVYNRPWWKVWDLPEGGHAVKLVGWGTDNGVDYWRIANSWDTTCGEDGYFRIVRGKNMCGIEGQAYAGLADV